MGWEKGRKVRRGCAPLNTSEFQGQGVHSPCIPGPSGTRPRTRVHLAKPEVQPSPRLPSQDLTSETPPRDPEVGLHHSRPAHLLVTLEEIDLTFRDPRIHPSTESPWSPAHSSPAPHIPRTQEYQTAFPSRANGVCTQDTPTPESGTDPHPRARGRPPRDPGTWFHPNLPKDPGVGGSHL